MAAATANGHAKTAAPVPSVNFSRRAKAGADAEAVRKAAAAEKSKEAVIEDMPTLDSLSTAAPPAAAPATPKASKKASSGQDSPAPAKKGGNTSGTRKPPVPPAVRGTVDHRGNVLGQQVAGRTDVIQKKKLHDAMSAMAKDAYQDTALSSLVLDVAMNGDNVLQRQLTEDTEKPKKPHSIEEVVKDIGAQAESLKLREGTKDAVNDAITHEMAIYYGTMTATTRTGSKDRAHSGPAEVYVARKEVLAKVKPYQFNPIEQQEHAALRQLEAAMARVGKSNIKVGEKGPHKVSEEEKEKHKKIKEAIAARQLEILNGKLREELVGDGSLADKFVEQLKKKNPNIDEEILKLIGQDPATAYNIEKVVNVTSEALQKKVEKEKRKEQARKEKEATEGLSESAKAKRAKEEKAAKEGGDKRKRRDPRDDGFYDPAQHADSLVKKEEGVNGPDQKSAAGAAPKKEEKKKKKKEKPKKKKKASEPKKKQKKSEEADDVLSKKKEESDDEKESTKKKAKGKKVVPVDTDMKDVKVKDEPKEDDDKKKKKQKRKKDDESSEKKSSSSKDKKKSKKDESSSNSSSFSSSSESESEEKDKKEKKKSKKDSK